MWESLPVPGGVASSCKVKDGACCCPTAGLLQGCRAAAGLMRAAEGCRAGHLELSRPGRTAWRATDRGLGTVHHACRRIPRAKAPAG